VTLLEVAAQAAGLKAKHVQSLVEEVNLSLPDALAALLFGDGDLEAAHVHVAVFMDCGGPANAWATLYGHTEVATVAGCSSVFQPRILEARCCVVCKFQTASHTIQLHVHGAYSQQNWRVCVNHVLHECSTCHGCGILGCRCVRT
jgi:hypothetical protein